MSSEDLRRRLGDPIVPKHPPVAKVAIIAVCSVCAASDGNVLAGDAVVTGPGEGGLIDFGIAGACENCKEPMFTPFSAIFAELKRVGVMK